MKGWMEKQTDVQINKKTSRPSRSEDFVQVRLQVEFWAYR